MVEWFSLVKNLQPGGGGYLPAGLEEEEEEGASQQIGSHAAHTVPLTVSSSLFDCCNGWLVWGVSYTRMVWVNGVR
jgi:hypothetical protein